MEIRVRGRVQGVGFRPTVWRFARELGFRGEVLNDAEGVLMRVGGSASRDRRSDRAHRARTAAAGADRSDRDARSSRRRCRRNSASPRAVAGDAHTAGRAGRRDLRRLRAGNRRSVRAPLPLSLRQLHALRPAPQHRHRHPLRSRQHDDGAVRDVPGVRAPNIDDPADRRFHAEAIACHACGPKARLVRLDGRAVELRPASRCSTMSTPPAG